ncbi:MAG: ABC transporter permease [Candidatus Limiplasma sp.]|nr:ABC transporter permease [Candidatus Limiplasma sp.]MEA5146298.1 ABC transporter permease [Candidatus Limiplasma sp.]
MIFADILSATILFAVPLLLVAMGGMSSERSGIINIALEGIMIIGALCGCLFLRYTDDMGFGANAPQLYMLLAILIAGIAGLLFSMLLAFASIRLKADQTIGGTALNMMAPALAVIVTWAAQGQAQTTILIPKWIRISQESLGMQPGTDFLSRMFFKSLYLTTPIAFLLLIAVIVFMYKTKTGLRLRACGEHPQAADSVGINVYRMRYLGVAISGFLGGIGGLAFTVAAGSGFQSSVAGYGFLALAVMIFGNWKPLNILGASLFFALFKIIGSYAGSIPFLPKFEGIKSSEYIYLMLPYIVTMIVLILTSKKSRAPKAEGVPYDKGGR